MKEHINCTPFRAMPIDKSVELGVTMPAVEPMVHRSERGNKGYKTGIIEDAHHDEIYNCEEIVAEWDVSKDKVDDAMKELTSEHIQTLCAAISESQKTQNECLFNAMALMILQNQN
ncbi:hypothetical protein ACHAW6_003118 [Cyclotella cf. meneghiniana]